MHNKVKPANHMHMWVVAVMCKKGYPHPIPERQACEYCSHLVCPFQYGFLFQDVLVIESLEDVGSLGHKLSAVGLDKLLKADQQVLLSLAVLKDKLKEQ